MWLAVNLCRRKVSLQVVEAGLFSPLSIAASLSACCYQGELRKVKRRQGIEKQFLSRKKAECTSIFARLEDIKSNCSTLLPSLSQQVAGLIHDHRIDRSTCSNTETEQISETSMSKFEPLMLIISDLEGLTSNPIAERAGITYYKSV